MRCRAPSTDHLSGNPPKSLSDAPVFSKSIGKVAPVTALNTVQFYIVISDWSQYTGPSAFSDGPPFRFLGLWSGNNGERAMSVFHQNNGAVMDDNDSDSLGVNSDAPPSEESNRVAVICNGLAVSLKTLELYQSDAGSDVRFVHLAAVQCQAYRNLHCRSIWGYGKGRYGFPFVY